jgi:hypothetical protein
MSSTPPIKTFFPFLATPAVLHVLWLCTWNFVHHVLVWISPLHAHTQFKAVGKSPLWQYMAAVGFYNAQQVIMQRFIYWGASLIYNL